MLLPRSLYVHLPFCRQRCHYCDFPIAVVPDPETASSDYVDLVLRELATLERPPEPLLSCYIGGGTPSLASGDTISRLIGAIDESLGLSPGAEVTLEADPGTFDAAKLCEYSSAGVTRISLGAQSFEESELAAAGRAHNLSDTLEAASLLSRDGELFPHGWSLDLISGLPGQTLDSWRRSLNKCIELDPCHVSVYDLQIQKGTAFARWYGSQRDVLFVDEDDDDRSSRSYKSASFGIERPALPTVDDTADMYIETSKTLRAAGYDHYEISSFAKRRRSVHNAMYWQPGASWFALGLGATSAHAKENRRYPSAVRRKRPTRLEDYRKYVMENENIGRGVSSVLDDDEDDDIFAALADDVLTSLRTSAGLPLARVRACSGARALSAVIRGAQDALDHDLAKIERCDTTRRTYLRLTDPHGFLLSNAIIATIFNELTLISPTSNEGGVF